MSFIIKVINEEGKGIPGVHVRLKFLGLTRGMSDRIYTDDDGMAQFDGYDDGAINIFIDHSNYGEYEYTDGDIIEIER